MKKRILFMFILLSCVRMNSIFACTAFYAANDAIALAGKNEDAISADHFIWFCPPEEGKYGRIYFGSNFFLDQKEASNGINNQGLFFYLVFAPDVELKSEFTGDAYQGNLLEKILEECSSIEEALILMKKYNNLQHYAHFLIMMGDRYGHSLIIELGKVIEHNRPFSILPLKDNIPCDQYLVAHHTLQNSQEISIQLFKKILANVHVEGTMGSGTTVYSTIFDLKNGKIHLFYFHNFIEEVIFDINSELKKGARTEKIESFFPKNISAEDYVDLKNKELKQKIESRSSKNISPEEYIKFKGEYESLEGSSSDRFTIILENDKLYITIDNQSKFELIPESPDKFFIPSVNGDFSLTFYADGSDHRYKVLAKHELYVIQQTFQKTQ